MKTSKIIITLTAMLGLALGGCLMEEDGIERTDDAEMELIHAPDVTPVGVPDHYDDTEDKIEPDPEPWEEEGEADDDDDPVRVVVQHACPGTPGGQDGGEGEGSGNND